jgi:hypothetical protein
MDSFEAVIASLLQRRGYWTQIGFKVELTQAEKRRIGRPSSPRWQLDVIGYRAKSNHLLVLECKSFLDSPGVRCTAFDGSKPKEQSDTNCFSIQRCVAWYFADSLFNWSGLAFVARTRK